jgi:hypothetical protein
MKIIEAMKQIKELQVQAEDLKRKIKQNHAHLNYESPVYGSEQKNRVDEWLQGFSDTLKEILRLRVAIQKTNLQTIVTIKINEKDVSKTIAEWIHRRRDLAKLEESVWRVLDDKGLKEGKMKDSSDEVIDVKIVRYYDPATRDNKIEEYRGEPTKIDSTLEVINAITDIIE